MIHIAIVEDIENDYDLFRDCLSNYKEKYNNLEEIDVIWYKNIPDFIKNFKKDKFEIIFMDIDVNGMSGMEASKEIRKIDPNFILLFVTNLAQYAIQGYSVEAMDFIVKPLNYYVFEIKFQRALEKLKKNKITMLPFIINYEKTTIKDSTIEYIEIIGHKMIIHTTNGDRVSYGTLKSVESMLAEYKITNYSRCNNYLLVNLKFVESISGYTVTVAGKKLDISHPKKTKFIEDFNNYLGKGGD